VPTLCEILWVTPLLQQWSSSFQSSAVEASTGAPWLWQVRRFQDDCLVILRKIWGQRLQGGRYPTRQEHLSASACDAAILVEIADNWDCGWQIPYVVMRIAARGLCAHPDVPDMVVQGVRIVSHVEEILQFMTRRGYALGLLEAEVCGRYEAPWIGEEPHPLLALQAMTEELDAMARSVVENLMDEV
jgi:hypothetical protein